MLKHSREENSYMIGEECGEVHWSAKLASSREMWLASIHVIYFHALGLMC